MQFLTTNTYEFPPFNIQNFSTKITHICTSHVTRIQSKKCHKTKIIKEHTPDNTQTTYKKTRIAKTTNHHPPPTSNRSNSPTLLTKAGFR
jgi:hypothetical protein